MLQWAVHDWTLILRLNVLTCNDFKISVYLFILWCEDPETSHFPSASERSSLPARIIHGCAATFARTWDVAGAVSQ